MATDKQQLRSDAELNRAALVLAARAVMAKQGLDAPLDQIAQAAGVGNATLYRRFPARRDLVAAVFAEERARYAAAIDHALADDDPWRAVRTYVLEICALQAESRALADLITSLDFPYVDRAVALGHLQELLSRAQVAGRLRPDVTVQDVALVLLANAGVVRRTADHAPESSPRLVALLLDGLQASAATPGPPAPDLASLERALADTT